MKEKTFPAKREEQAPATREESRTLTPPVDIFEIEDGLAVVADLPGVGKDNIEVHVEDDVLTIKGEAKPCCEHAGNYQEFALGTYFRQFQLGEHVDQSGIKADMKHGVLTIQLPKAEKARPKKISVNVQS